MTTIGTTTEIQRETNGVREKLRIEHLRAEVAAMVAGKAGQTEKIRRERFGSQSAARASGAAEVSSAATSPQRLRRPISHGSGQPRVAAIARNSSSSSVPMRLS